jgi:hypothetical protein
LGGCADVKQVISSVAAAPHNSTHIQNINIGLAVALYEFSLDGFKSIKETSFPEIGTKERAHLQAALRDSISAITPETDTIVNRGRVRRIRRRETPAVAQLQPFGKTSFNATSARRAVEAPTPQPEALRCPVRTRVASAVFQNRFQIPKGKRGNHR